LRRLRQTLGLTQRQLAERLKLHPNTIWQYEKGWRGIRPQIAERIARLVSTHGQPLRP
jgi:transcriptional regulator with XRE-family HTH domain